MGYAVLRYNIAGDVPWKDVPIFVFNKGISLASFILMTVSFSLGPLKNLGLRCSNELLETRKSLGVVGLMYAFTHVVMSVSILNPFYYINFYEANGSLSFRGGLSILGGVCSLVLLWAHYLSFKVGLKKMYAILKGITSRKIIVPIFFFMGVHLFFLGYTGWTTVGQWQAGLPPISLLSFIIFCFGFLVNLIGRR